MENEFFPERFRDFVFADEDIYRTALAVIGELYGPEEGLSKSHHYSSRKFLCILSPFTPETFSLASLKERLSHMVCVHGVSRLLLLFLCRYLDRYAADDVAEARELLPRLEGIRDGFGHLMEPCVHSFHNLIIYQYNSRPLYCFLKTDDRLALHFLRTFLSETYIRHSVFPSQWVIDIFVDMVVRTMESRGVRCGKDMDEEVFFDLVDTALSLRDGRKRFIPLVVGFYMCGADRLGFSVEGPYFTREMVFSHYMSKFLNREYTCRQNAFRLNRRDAGWSLVLVNVDLPVPSLRPVIEHMMGSGLLSSYEYRALRGRLFSSLEGTVRDWSSFEFTEDCFFVQIDFYRKFYRDDPVSLSFAVGALRALYLSVDRHSGGTFLRTARVLTYGVLTTPRFIPYIEKGYIFTPYSPYDRIDSGLRRVFFIYDIDDNKRTLLREDYIGVDLSAIHNPFYRSLAWQYLTSELRRLRRPTFACTLRQLLVFLDKSKHTPGYRSPEQDRFTIWDAVMVAEHFDRQHDTESAFNSSVCTVRDFLRWARGSGHMSVDEVSFECLKKKKIPPRVDSTPVISDREFTTICSWLLERAKRDAKYAQAFIIMNLLTITPLRVGTACRMMRCHLEFDSALDTFIYTGPTKGTRGANDVIVLGGRASEFVRKAFAISDEVGAACPNRDLTAFLFVCRERCHYDVFTTQRFRKLMKRACEACSLPVYGPKNLRATYMTKSYIEYCEVGRADKAVLRLFAYHKNARTTLEHYVNQSEALSALTDFLKKGNDWQKVIYPDEVAALQAVIDDQLRLIEQTADPREETLLRCDLDDLQEQMRQLRSPSGRKHKN